MVNLLRQGTLTLIPLLWLEGLEPSESGQPLWFESLANF